MKIKARITQLEVNRDLLILLGGEIAANVAGIRDVLDCNSKTLSLPSQKDLLSISEHIESAFQILGKVSEEVIGMRLANRLMDAEPDHEL